MSEKNENEMAVPKELMTPAAQAYMNTQLRETIAAMFRELAPTLQSIALTPEKIQAMEDARRAPSDTQIARSKREERERAMQREDIETARKEREAMQNNCPHKYPNGSLALATISNRPDRQRLLICFKNHCLITPGMWVIGPPDKDNPRGRAYFDKPHPDYARLIREYDTAHSGQ